MVCPGFSVSRLEPKTVSVPQDDIDVIVTAVLILLEVLFVTRPNTPTVPPGLIVDGFTLMDIPTSEELCAVASAGISTMDKQMAATILLIKWFLINLSSSFSHSSALLGNWIDGRASRFNKRRSNEPKRVKVFFPGEAKDVAPGPVLQISSGESLR